LLILSIYTVSQLSSSSSSSLLPSAYAATTTTACNNLSVKSISASGDNGNPASYAIDNNLSTRWSEDGVGSWITADLGTRNTVCSISIAWYMGSDRVYSFSIATSSDGSNYITQYSGKSSGTTTNSETYNFYDTNARYLKITVNGNTQNTFASISELDIFGSYSSDLTSPTIAITSPSAGSTLAGGSITAKGTASDNNGGGTGIQVVVVKIDNGNYVKATPKATGDWSTWTAIVSTSTQGTHSITAKAYDISGNQQWTSVSFGVSTSSGSGGSSSGGTLYDNFESGTYSLVDGQTSPNGKWKDVYNGYGSAGVIVDASTAYQNVFHAKPATATGSSVVNSDQTTSGTHAALIISTAKFHNYKLSLDMRTDKQLRQSNPNTWEVAWVMFNYVDEWHHYYFTLKTNGYELGKKDNTKQLEQQVTLKEGTNMKNTIGTWYHLDIFVIDNHITIYVNNVKLANVYDTGMSSYFTNGGKIGLYTEDAEVRYDKVTIEPL
jgi:hypothetical protein